ncbi:MAG: penicillin-binding protein 1A [Rhodospirillaceae bacterium]
MGRVLLRLLALLLLLVLAGMGGLYWLLYHYGRDLPDYYRLVDYEPPTVTRVHAGDGRLLAEFASERRVFIPIEAMPKRVVRAFLSAEDKNFYDHPGIDIQGVMRALITNFEHMHSDRRPMGASTITQQVAKNFLLTNEVSLARKVKEAILALRIEQALSKDRILELYLNEIFLGSRSYGVAAAALNYFNKALDQLTIADAAFLAALPKAPNNYNPERQHDAAVARRNWVIGRMAEDGVITAAEAAEAIAQPLEIRRRDITEQVTAEYFSEEVRRELLKHFGEKSLYEGGLSVRTTLDPQLQEIASRSLRRGLIAYDRRHGWRGPVARVASAELWQRQLATTTMPKGAEAWRLAAVLEYGGGGKGKSGDEAVIGFANGDKARIPAAELRWARPARGDIVLVESLGAGDSFGLRQVPEVQGGLVAMDPHTGRVLAMSGGFSPTMSQFNRATQAMRQPGSAFKPFVYLTALDNGFTPSSLVLDAPFEYDPGHGQPVWRPENYHQAYYGPTPLRVGIEKSRNLMTVRLAEKIGMGKVKAIVEKFGIIDNFQPYLPMALGAGETTVLRMVTAYAMLDNGGKRITPTIIDRVQDRAGKTIYRHDDRACGGCTGLAWKPGLEAPEPPDTREQIEDPRTCYQIVNIMTGVIQRGTAARLAALGRPLAGKTGTTNDSNDAWFVGFSPDLVVGLYVGYDQPQSLGDRETGGSTAVPIFESFMAEALKGKPASPFRVPKGVRLVRVDPETGRLADPGAKKTIWEAFLPGTEPGAEPETPVLDIGAGPTPGFADPGAPLNPDSDPMITGTDTYTGSTSASSAPVSLSVTPLSVTPMPAPPTPFVPSAPSPAPAPAAPANPAGANTGGTGGLY